MVGVELSAFVDVFFYLFVSRPETKISENKK